MKLNQLSVSCDFCGKIPDSYNIIIKKVKNTERNFVECPGCGLRFFSPRMSWQQVKDEIWHEENEKIVQVANNCYKTGKLLASKGDPEKQKTYLQNYYKNLYNKIILHNKAARPNILEIGCNVGWFLKQCEEHTLNTCQGIDINFEAVRIATEKRNLNVRCEDFNESCINEKFDWVIMLDYIEHSYFPYQNFLKVYQVLNPGGLIVIKTFLEELDPEHKMMSPPFHAHHFFGYVLYKMLHNASFKVVRWDFEGDNVFIIAEKGENL